MQLEAVAPSYDRVSRYCNPLTDIVFGGALRLEKFRRRVI